MKWYLLFLLLVMGCGQVSQDPAARVEQLGQGIRCPVCRGVSIRDSPSSLAIEMMQILKDQVAAGKSDEEIFKFFEDRYGEWVLLQPKAEGMNILVWLLPALFIGGGATFILFEAKKAKKQETQ